jgi:hypothetical protein
VVQFSAKKIIFGAKFRIIDLFGINFNPEILDKIVLKCFVLKTNSKHEIGAVNIEKLVSGELLIQLDYAEALDLNLSCINW